MIGIDIDDIRKQLHDTIRARLFGSGPWLQDRETNVALHKQLLDCGLIKYRDEYGAFSNTELGAELELDLLECFIGHHEPWEIPDVLLKHGLLTPAEADEVIFIRLEQNGETPEAVLPPILRRLYIERFGTP